MSKRTLLGSAAVLALVSGAAAQECQVTWDGTPGNPGIASGYISPLFVWNDGTGDKLYAGGSFQDVGGTGARFAAAWNPATSSWEGLGSGIPASFVTGFGTYDAGSGERLIITGVNWQNVAGLAGTRGIVQWDGQNFHSTDAPWTTGGVYGATSWHNGTQEVLVAAGSFTWAGGSDRTAMWDGVSWSPMQSVSGSVLVVATFNNEVYIGGSFTSPVDGLARWDGASWQPVGGGVARTGSIQSMAVLNDGTGEALYVGGRRFSAGFHPYRHVNKWDGQDWTPIANDVIAVGTTGEIRSLAMFDDGTGPKLYAGGRNSDFNSMGYIMRVENDEWVPLVHGTADAVVHGLLVWDERLYMAGSFSQIGGQPASGIAALVGCAGGTACYADCDGNEVLNIDDFLCFINAFAQQDPYADCDDNGVFNIDDFLCFINEFAQGCP